MAFIDRTILGVNSLLNQLITRVLATPGYFDTPWHSTTTHILVKSHNFTASAFEICIVRTDLLSDVVLAWATVFAVVNNTSICNCKSFTKWIVAWDINLRAFVILGYLAWKTFVAVFFKAFITITQSKHVLVLFYTFRHWWRRYWLPDNTTNTA
jgi:hypothetical protein